MRIGRLLFLVFVAPILVIVDLLWMIVRFDRNRLTMAAENTWAAVVRVFGRSRA